MWIRGCNGVGSSPSWARETSDDVVRCDIRSGRARRLVTRRGGRVWEGRMGVGAMAGRVVCKV